MTDIDRLPNEVVVTDQVVKISDFSESWKNKVVLLTEDIFKRYRESGKKRYIVVFAGPSGSGKSTTAEVVRILLEKILQGVEVLSVGQDGYHYSQDYLNKNYDENNDSLSKHKGRYDSFDVTRIKNDLESFRHGKSVTFPVYSRKTHDPIEAGSLCGEGNPSIIIFDGLWLLYNRFPWIDLLPLYDLKVFFRSDPDELRKNTIDRHVRGGKTHDEAKIFYDQSDSINTKLILNNICSHDLDFLSG